MLLETQRRKIKSNMVQWDRERRKHMKQRIVSHERLERKGPTVIECIPDKIQSGREGDVTYIHERTTEKMKRK